MLSALRALGGRFASWVTGEGARAAAKQAAQNQATKIVAGQAGKMGVQGYYKAGEVMDEVYRAKDPTYNRSEQALKNIDRGQKKIGFLGSVGISIAIGVAVSFLVPGAGIIAVGIVQGVGTTVAEGAIGVMAGEDEPTPAPTEEPEPVVQGQVGDDTPSVQSDNTPPPQEEVIIIQTTPSHEDDVDIEEPEPPDPHDSEPCCEDEDPHLDPHEP